MEKYLMLYSQFNIFLSDSSLLSPFYADEIEMEKCNFLLPQFVVYIQQVAMLIFKLNFEFFN